MRYREFVQLLLDRGFTRVERDDRMLDVFPREDREKGIELWEKWAGNNMNIMRVRLPYNEKKAQLFEVPKEKFESLLQENIVASLDSYNVIAEGEIIFE